MRELTKSVFSASWAMSLFGVQQMANLTDPGRASRAFDAVAQAAADGFDGVTRAAYETGDRLQRQMVDLTLGMFGCCGGARANQGAHEPSGPVQPEARDRSRNGAARAAGREVPPGYAPPGAPPTAAGRPAPTDVAQTRGWGPMPGSTGGR